MKNSESTPPREEISVPEAASPAVEETPDPQAEAARFKDLALRAQADLDNYRKRVIREKEEAIRYANSSLLEKFLPILDNFELGLEAARSASDTTSIVEGMTIVQNQFQDFLKSHGVEPIPAEGEVFDPAHHDAMAQENSETVPEGHIVRQVRKGYKLKDRLLRASGVTVSKGSAK